MTRVAKFTFNPFQENTYIVYDETRKCVVIDPGCYTEVERNQLKAFIDENKLNPVRLINTHCHVDHVFGNRFIADTYNLALEIHKGEIPVLESVPQVCKLYGIPLPQPSPKAERFIEEGELIEFGNSKLKTLFTPGHSPASISFYCKQYKFVIAGDVLFYGSIGRTDLPGGNYNTLIASIKNQFFHLGDDVVVYPGHGEKTTIGFEKEQNPFLQ